MSRKPTYRSMDVRFHTTLSGSGRNRRANRHLTKTEATCGFCGQGWDSCSSEMVQWELFSLGWWFIPRTIIETRWLCPHCVPKFVRFLRSNDLFHLGI